MIKILNTYSQNEITVEQTADNQLSIRSGKSSSKLAVLGEESFMFSMDELDLENAQEFSLDQRYMDGLERCLVSVGKDPTHPFQLGVTITYGKEGINLYSTDNHSLSKYELGGRTKKSGSAILPESFCTTLLSIMRSHKQYVPANLAESKSKDKEKGQAVLSIGEGFAFARIGPDVRLFTKLVTDLRPVNFEDAIAINMERASASFDEFQEIPPDLTNSLDRAMIFVAKTNEKVMECIIDGPSMKMRTESPEGSLSDSLVFKESISEVPLKFRIDPYNLSRVIGNCAFISFSDGLCLMRSENEKYTHLVQYYKPRDEKEKAPDSDENDED